MWSYTLVLAAVASSQLVAAEIDRRRFSNPTYYNVGGVLSSNESVAFFKDTISVSHFLRRFNAVINNLSLAHNCLI